MFNHLLECRRAVKGVRNRSRPFSLTSFKAGQQDLNKQTGRREDREAD
jgi:hypothetical protein